jgi:hypothetical protein
MSGNVDAELLTSGGVDFTVRLWTFDGSNMVQVGEPIRSEYLPEPTTPQLIVNTTRTDHVLIWDIVPDTWPEVACRAAGRNLTRAEWAQYAPTASPTARPAPMCSAPACSRSLVPPIPDADRG